MTNGSSQKPNNVFYLSRYRGVIYTLGVFVLSAFVMFWAVNLMVGRLWEISVLELAAVLCFAIGAAALFFIIFKLTEVKPMVAVTDSGLTFKRGKKTGFIRFADIASVREHVGLLGKILKTKKVAVETHLGSFAIYLAPEDVAAFFAAIPEAERKRVGEKSAEEIVSAGEKNICFLSAFVLLTCALALLIATTLPAATALLDGFSQSRYYLFALLALYGIALVCCFGRYVYLLIRYAKYSVKIEGDRFVISYGKVTKTENSLFFDSILAVRLRADFIERLFGVCRVSVESRQKAKGISDNEYFPFLMKKKDADAVLAAVLPAAGEADAQGAAEGTIARCEMKKTGAKVLVAYAERWIWFVAADVILSIFATPWLLLLLVLPVLAVASAYCSGRYSLGKEFAVFEYGVFARNRAVVRYAEMQSVTSSVNISSARLGLCDTDVTVGRFTRVFQVGYINSRDFSELAEKLEKKVDKDS